MKVEGIQIFNWKTYTVDGSDDAMFVRGLGVSAISIQLGKSTDDMYWLPQVLFIS